MKLLFLVLSIFLLTDDLDRVAFTGTVSDAAGNAIAEARVAARHLATGQEQIVAGNRQGQYRLINLSPGIYRLRAEAPGFQPFEYEGVNVVAGQTLRLDFSLAPGRIEEAVTIRSIDDDVRVDTTRTVVGATIGMSQLRDLPVESRNPLDLVFALPGTALPGLSDKDLAEGDRTVSYRRTPEESGIFSLHGGTPFSNNLTIEGLDNNDDRAARERFIPTMQAVEEVQVIANQFSAEYGRASGGRVNLRLRGGANSFHGELFHYYRDARLNANGFFRNADPRRAARLPFFNSNPGATLGGPIRKERALFFAAYEFDYIDDRAEIAALVPASRHTSFPLPQPNGQILGITAVDKKGKTVEINGGEAVGLYDLALKTPRTSHTWQGRFDLHVSNRHQLAAFVTMNRSADERGFPGGRRMLETMRRTGRSSQSWSVSDQAVISPRWFNSLRFQFSRLKPTDSTGNDSPVVLIEIDDPRDTIGDSASNPLSRGGRLVAGSSNLSGLDRREDRWQWQETLTGAIGSHTLRVGVDAHLIRSRFRDLTDASGTFTFETPADFLAGRPSRYVHRFNTESRLANSYLGLFWQDDWRIRPELTVAFGLRWDNESAMADRNNFGPRLSLAWDPRKSGRTVMRAGYGLFYNRAMLRTLDDFTLTSRTLLLDTNQSPALLDRLAFPATLSPADSLALASALPESGFLRRLERGFRIPESSQASLGLERELWRGGKIEINYVFHRGSHLWRESNLNAPRLPDGFRTFTEYLLSRDFPNAKDPATGERPIIATGNADLVRFSLSDKASESIKENGKSIIVFGLNSASTSNATSGIRAAQAVLRAFRPQPELTQVEELQARGNSFYHGLTIEWQQRLSSRGTVRVGYTLSRLIDDGVVNTSSPLVAGDFRGERSLSLLDARRRVVVSGIYRLAGFTLSGILNYSSPRPFSLGINGNDRNLDDVSNDRPNFTGDYSSIVWRRPGETAPLEGLSLPTIGSVGNLPRNAGRGPAIHTLNLRLSRSFKLGEKRELQFQVEAFNPLNTTVFSFGAEYVDYDDLAPRRTIKPRTMRLGLRYEF